MPNLTDNLSLNVFLENEAVNFEDINANFEKLDGITMCIDSGTKTASYSGGSDSVAAWRYKKYSDGTIDMSTKLSFTNLKCNGGTETPYYSGDVTVYFPFGFSEIYDVQMHLTTSQKEWISDVTTESAATVITDHIKFNLLSANQESETTYKQVFINIKGVI